jgi:Nucleotidyl transferase AbiEii toxin, Type IV TA system
MEPGYPKTYQGLPSGDPRPNDPRPKVFDPALCHFGQGYRLGEPSFQDQATSNHWYQCRRRVMNYLLNLIAYSAWHEHLVLRGSLLLKAWLGDLAREPGDIDWVVQPDSLTGSDAKAQQMIQEIIGLAHQRPQWDDITIQVGQIAVDQIWTYERAEGRRIVFPWQAEGLPPGDVQMDFVFQEKLPETPIRTTLPGVAIPFAAVSPRLSLAWKLLWLETDRFPQGKDLYDATLLAERVTLPLPLLQHVLTASSDWQLPRSKTWDDRFPWNLSANDLEWATFQREYPQIVGRGEDWIELLRAALAPTWDGVSPRLGELNGFQGLA